VQIKLIPIGNSFGIRLPKSIIKQFNFDKNNLEIVIKENGILITAISDVPPLQDWDKLFLEAKKNGFDSKNDEAEFSDWDTTLADGIE